MASRVRVMSVPDGVSTRGVIAKVSLAYCPLVKSRLSRKKGKYMGYMKLLCGSHIFDFCLKFGM